MSTVLDVLSGAEGFDASDPWLEEKIAQQGYSTMDVGDERFVLADRGGERINNLGPIIAELNGISPTIERGGKAFQPGQDTYEQLLKVPEISDLVKKLGKDAFPVDEKGRQLISREAADQINRATGGYDGSGFFAADGPFAAYGKTIGPMMGLSGALNAFGVSGVMDGYAYQSLGSSLSQNAALQGGSFADIANAVTGGSGISPTALTGDAAAATSTAAAGAAANAAGLGQMATDAGLTGAAADSFVASGGILGSTASATGTAGAAANQLGLEQMAGDAGLSGPAATSFVESGGTLGSTAAGGGGAQSIIDQWLAEASGATIDAPTTRTVGDTITPSAKDVAQPMSNTAKAAQELVNGAQAPAPVTEVDLKALSKAGASQSTIERFSEWLTTHNKLAGAAVTTAGGIIGGIGTASLNRDTMERKAELEAQTLKDVLATKQSTAAENAFTGNVGIRPAATRTPLKRLSTGAPVYSPGGLINSVRRA